MIDDNTKVIFIENPKSASTAVRRAMTGVVHMGLDDPRVGTVSHQVPAIIAKKYPQQWLAYRSFVVVRNTWDRALSIFRFYARSLNAESYQKYNFDSWVNAGCPPPEETIHRAILPYPENGEHPFSQLQYARNVDHVITLHSADPVNRAQQLQQALVSLAQQWQFSLFPVSYDINHSARQSVSERWTSESIATIGQLFNEEINCFGFQAPRED